MPKILIPSHALLLVKLAHIFKQVSVPYMVVGGQAVLRHGEPRMTRDIDVMLAISATNAQPVLKLLKNKRITPLVDDPMEFIRRTHVLPSQTQDTYLRVDLSFTDSPYELQAIARGEDVVIDGTPVRFATAEDLVIHKIIAGRAIDHQDVLGILLKNPGLDLAYTRNWLGQFASALDKPLREDFEKLWDLSQK